jgi:hypothetical protein
MSLDSSANIESIIRDIIGEHQPSRYTTSPESEIYQNQLKDLHSKLMASAQDMISARLLKAEDVKKIEAAFYVADYITTGQTRRSGDKIELAHEVEVAVSLMKEYYKFAVPSQDEGRNMPMLQAHDVVIPLLHDTAENLSDTKKRTVDPKPGTYGHISQILSAYDAVVKALSSPVPEPEHKKKSALQKAKDWLADKKERWFVKTEEKLEALVGKNQFFLPEDHLLTIASGINALTHKKGDSFMTYVRDIKKGLDYNLAVHLYIYKVIDRILNTEETKESIQASFFDQPIQRRLTAGPFKNCQLAEALGEFEAMNSMRTWMKPDAFYPFLLAKRDDLNTRTLIEADKLLRLYDRWRDSLDSAQAERLTRACLIIKKKELPYEKSSQFTEVTKPEAVPNKWRNFLIERANDFTFLRNSLQNRGIRQQDPSIFAGILQYTAYESEKKGKTPEELDNEVRFGLPFSGIDKQLEWERADIIKPYMALRTDVPELQEDDTWPLRQFTQLYVFYRIALYQSNYKKHRIKGMI